MKPKNTYYLPKADFGDGQVKKLRLFFDNGDYLTFCEKEISYIDINFYDRMIWYNGEICRVANSGTIRLSVKEEKHDYKGIDGFLKNEKEYLNDTAAYIKNRCVNEGGISYIMLFNEDNWSETIFGDIVANEENDCLVLNFNENDKYGTSDGKNNYIELNDLSKDIINNICLDFENCEGINIYQDEIIDIKIEFEEKFLYDQWFMHRSIKSGFIKFRLNKDYNNRTINLIDDRVPDVKQLEKRICPKRGISKHDICNLYVEYDYAGYGRRRIEQLNIEGNEIRCKTENCPDGEYSEEEGSDIFCFIGGYSKKLSDGSLIVTFGYNAEEMLKEMLI